MELRTAWLYGLNKGGYMRGKNANWSEVQTVLIDGLEDDEMHAETLIKLIGIFTKLELESVRECAEEYSEGDGALLHLLNYYI